MWSQHPYWIERCVGLIHMKLQFYILHFSFLILRTDETCAFAAAQAFEWAQARIYVTNKFTDEARSTVNDMVTNLRTAFKSLLDANVWMDKNTIVTLN